MELTLDQALQKGIEAHKAGKVQEADQYYTAILKSNPKHPDANHNMGVLAIGVGKVNEAIPFFKTALEANSNIAQYWLSYIAALIKLDRLADAKAAFEQARQQGVKGIAFDQSEKNLNTASVEVKNQTQEDTQTQYNILGELKLDKALKLAQKKAKDGRNEDAQKIYQDILKEFPKNKKALYGIKILATKTPAHTSDMQEPPSDQLQSLVNLYRQGQYHEALNKGSQLLEQFPNSINLYNITGAASKSLGRLDEAIKAYKEALSIKTDHAETYYNLGIALKEHGKPNEAIEAYNKALSIKPNFAEAYYNLGIALKEHRKPNEAIEAYNKALSIKTDYAEAYNNLGIALKEQRKLDEAIEAYNKALSIKPNYVEAYNNLGIALEKKGTLDEAIEAYNKALSIKPDYADAWNNLYFPLQAMKSKIKSDQNLNVFDSKGINSIYGKIQLAILDYRLYRGQKNESLYLDRALSLLSNADNIVIQNPKFDNSVNDQIHSLPDNMVALVHFGRSGTGLVHSLIDGHPEVSTLPSIYFSEYFDHSNWVRLISDGWDGMVDRFIEAYKVLFDASSSVPVWSIGKRLLEDIGIKEGMANVGDQRNEVLKIDENLFKEELKRLMASFNDLDAFKFFSLVHSAYNAAINDTNSKNLIFYHIHNPSTHAKLNFVRLNPNANWLLMVREPIQSLESWMRIAFTENDYFGVANTILTMLFDTDNSVYSKQNSTGVRLEDLKKQPQKTIQALCKWMGIKESESLYEMTAQGKKWWGDPNSPDYKKDGHEPFGKTSIKRKVGSIFSEKDQFVLQTLFYPFSVRFGYLKENKEQFKNDLETIRPMLDSLFDFERAIAEKMQVRCEKLIGSGSYLYLRSGLIERWNTLHKYQTYPNMITPLKI